MAESLREEGWRVGVMELAGEFPEPDAAARADAGRGLARLPAGSMAVVDGLAFSALPDEAEAHAGRLRLVALVHLPIAAAVGLEADRAARFAADERRALAAAAGIVVTGSGGRSLLARYDLDGDRVWMVPPGTDPAPIAPGSHDGALRLLSVAAVHRGKGHDILMEALAAAPAIAWTLTCAGSLTRDLEQVDAVRRQVVELGLRDRVSFTGDLSADALDVHYAHADVFVLPTLQETYGMAVAEALARGLPVVSTDTGDIANLVGPDAGLIVPPGNSGRFAAALQSVLTDAALRARLAEGARRRRRSLPTWRASAARLATVLEEVAGRG
jgi:glycosyltransferase involved in cell wall biosynthesis